MQNQNILNEILPLSNKYDVGFRVDKPKGRFADLVARAEKVGLYLCKSADKKYPYDVYHNGTISSERTLNNVLYRHIKPMEDK
jgi:hypothetical protein